MKKKIIKTISAVFMAFSFVFTGINITYSPYEVYAFNEKLGYVTGEEVNVRTGAGTSNSKICTLKLGHEVTIKGEETAPNGAVWYLIEFVLDGETMTGYMHSNYIRTVLPQVGADEDKEYEQYLELQNFPESYRVYLRALHKAHPTWTFVALPTGLEWNTVVEKESELGANLVPVSSNSSWKSLEEGAYDWNSNTWIGLDGSSWVAASKSVVKYYLDPRNFLRENGEILQFESLKYIDGEQTLEGIANVLSGTFMDSEEYYRIFMEAGKECGVNPYHLAARCRQEVGSSGSNSTFDKKDDAYSEFDGYYNFFNIGASPSAEHNSMYNGLQRAKNEGWDTPEKAIKGGAKIVAEKYILVDQDTLYLEKFDVVDGGNGYYWHQYMTNLQAAASESSIMKRAYKDFDEAVVTYYVPVYLNMPDYSNDCPTYNGSVNCVLSSLSLDGYEFSEEFDPYKTEYTVKDKVDITTMPAVSALAYSSSADIAVDDKLTENKIIVTCTGSDGESLTYTINLENTYNNNTKKGDVNSDGKIDVSDAYMIMQSQTGLITLTEEQEKLADVDESGEVDVSDALAILKQL